MAIDHIIDYDCEPKRQLSVQGILERVKGEQRAQEIIGLFRRNGDDRPPSEMGFEFTRSTPTGEEEQQVIVVQDLLDSADELRPLEHHCQGCPANRIGKPFGCMDFVKYPISSQAEQWLLDRLPVPDEPLIWLLLRQGVKEFKYDGSSIQPLREADDIYFEEDRVFTRKLGELTINTNQLFEMIFAVGQRINPNHAALLLLFLNVIPRDLEADDIMHITPAPPDADTRYPFQLQTLETDDESIYQIKGFLHALYMAWRLNVHLLLDA